MNNCKNCQKELTGEFCSNCGASVHLKRIDRQYIVDEVSSVLNLDRGIFYTIKELLIRPGDTIREFILENRKRIVKPIFFIIVCSIVYSVAQQYLSFEAGYIKFNYSAENVPFAVKMFDWFSRNYGYMNILMAIPIAFWIRLFFKKYNYNYYEIYILLCFIMGISMLIHTVLGVVESVFGYSILKFGIIITFFYSAWAIGQFFDRKKKLNYLKGFLSYFFGILTSLGIFMLLGTVLEKFIS